MHQERWRSPPIGRERGSESTAASRSLVMMGWSFVWIRHDGFSSADPLGGTSGRWLHSDEPDCGAFAERAGADCLDD